MPLLKTFLILAFLAMQVRMKCPIGLALVFSAIATGLLFGMTPDLLARQLWEGATTTASIELAMTIGCLLIISNTLEQSGRMTRIATHISRLLPGRRTALVVLPGVVGLLPMPGGAMFSAPMVKANQKFELSAERNTVINYWFRHIWEYCWPLYPGLMIAANILDVPLHSLIVRMWPFSICALFGGIFFLLPRQRSTRTMSPAEKVSRPATEGLPHNSCWHSEDVGDGKNSRLFPFAKGREKPGLRQENQDTPLEGVEKECFDSDECWRGGGGSGAQMGRFRALLRVLVDFAPVLTVLVIFLVGAVPLSACVAFGALLAIVMTVAAGDLKISLGGRCTFLSRTFLFFMLLGIGTKVFGHVVEKSGAAEEVVTFIFAHMGYAPLVVAIVTPMIVGALTGFTAAFVATALPLVLQMQVSGGDPLPIAVLAYLSGFVGVLLSPAHACLVLTNEYFGSRLGKVYRMMLIPVAMLLAMGLGMYFLLQSWP